MTPAAVAKDVKVVVKGQPQRVMSSEDKLAVVLVNLLDNAVKYSPPGGRVDVCLAGCGDAWAELTIRDQGPGFGADKTFPNVLNKANPALIPSSVALASGCSL